jgi:hypothetical protein
MDLILSYLVDNKLPEDRKEAKMIKRKAPKYWVSKEGLLYRRSFTGPYLLCVHPEKIQTSSSKYMREFAEVIQGEDRWLTGRYLRDIGGHTCRPTP